MSNKASIDDLPDYNPNEVSLEDLPSPTSSKGKISQLEALIQGAAQGPTLGFADELAGGLAAAGAAVTGQPTDGKYEEYRDLIRRKLEAAEKEWPKTTMAGELVGGLAIPGLGLASLEKAGVTTAAKLAKKALTSPTLYGAISGAGASNSDSVLDTALDSAKGATIGKGMSLVGPLTGAAVGAATGYMTSDDSDDAKINALLGGIAGGAIGHTNKAVGSDAVSTLEKAGNNYKVAKKMASIIKDPRDLGSASGLNKALNEDVTSAAQNITQNLAQRDKEISSQFGEAIRKATDSGKVADIRGILQELKDKLSSSRTLTAAENQDKDLLLSHLDEVAQKIDTSKATPRDIKDIELSSEVLEDRLKSPMEQKFSAISNLLESYNNKLNKALYTTAPETKELGSALAAEREIKENIFGITKKDDELAQAEKIAKYIRQKSQDSGIATENAQTADALAKAKAKESVMGNQALSEIEKLVETPVKQYSTAASVKGYDPTPTVGIIKKAVDTLGGVGGITAKVTSNYNKSIAAVKNFTPEKFQKVVNSGLISDKSVLAKLGDLAMEKDPVKRNAMIFSLSQSQNGADALEKINSEEP